MSDEGSVMFLELTDLLAGLVGRGPASLFPSGQLALAVGPLQPQLDLLEPDRFMKSRSRFFEQSTERRGGP